MYNNAYVNPLNFCTSLTVIEMCNENVTFVDDLIWLRTYSLIPIGCFFIFFCFFQPLKKEQSQQI